MIRLSGCLLEVAPCKNRTARILFIKEVQTHLGANHFTSEGPRGSRGGEGCVNCCRHEFFGTHSFALNSDFFCVWMGLKK